MVFDGFMHPSGTPTPHLSLDVFHNCIWDKGNHSFDSGKIFILTWSVCKSLSFSSLSYSALFLYSYCEIQEFKDGPEVCLQLISSSTWAVRLAIHLCIFLDGSWLTHDPSQWQHFPGWYFLLLIIMLKYEFLFFSVNHYINIGVVG